MMPLLRPAPLAAALMLALVLAPAAPALGEERSLPDIGSSAGEIISPEQEGQYGGYMLYELRRMGWVLEDPLVDTWLKDMGHRLGAASDTPQQEYRFFMLRDRQINAFATLGGYIGVNAGLVLAATNEDEVAGVLSHEISHVSQRHVLRSVERARKDQLPIMLAMLGAVLASQASNRDSAHDATGAVIAGGQALLIQRQLDYSRANESEADRLGIQTLHRAGYRPSGMPDFFERMQRANRGNTGGDQVPEYLRSHPITTTRISESRERAQRLASESPRVQSTAALPINPLLPGQFTLAPASRPPTDDGMFDWARERLRVLSASSAAVALAEYTALFKQPGARFSDAQRYGRALAQLGAGQPAAAEAGFESLLEQYPGQLWLELGLAEAAQAGRKPDVARQRFEALLRRNPEHRAVSLAYARALNEIDTVEAGRRAQAVLRPLLSVSAEDPLFQRSFGRASELAGDLARAGEAYAEAAFLNGRAVDALDQLDALKKRSDLDYYQRARVEARIAAITPIVLEMRRQGIDPEDQPADRG